MADIYVDPAINANSGTGTIGDPFGDLQYALSNTTQGSWGDTFHIKAGTDEVLTAALSLATYGTPAYNKPLIFRGYTATAGDGGMGGISGAATYTIMAATPYATFIDMHLHNTGSADIIDANTNQMFLRCELNNSTGHGIDNSNAGRCIAIGCYFHDIGAATKYMFNSTVHGSVVAGCYFVAGANSPAGAISAHIAVNNIIIVSGGIRGIYARASCGLIWGNTIYSTTGTSEGIYFTDQFQVAANNVIQGFSGSGGDAINSDYVYTAIGNAIYNNTSGISTGAYPNELNDSLGSAPFVNAAGGDFDINGTIAGLTEDGWPVSWPGLTTNTLPKADKGASQAGAGAGGGGGPVVGSRVIRGLGAI